MGEQRGNGKGALDSDHYECLTCYSWLSIRGIALAGDSKRLFETFNLVATTLGAIFLGLATAFVVGAAYNERFEGSSLPIWQITSGAALLVGVACGALLFRRRKKETDGTTVGIATDDLFYIPDSSISVWLKPTDSSTEQIRRANSDIPILLIANLKGGVAKTMLSANIAAYFSTRQEAPKKVTLIDLDYQGSLSKMIQRDLPLLSNGESAELAATCSVEGLFDRDLSDSDCLLRAETDFEEFKSFRFYSCDYGFDDFEVIRQFEWLAGIEKHDVRFLLRERLLSEEFQKNSDIIIIDTGPRLTLGSVNAIAAATHVFVPTTTDTRSLEATRTFLARLANLKFGPEQVEDGDPIAPNLKVIGAISTIVSGGAAADESNSKLERTLEQALYTEDRLGALLPPRPLFFPTRLRKAGPIFDTAQTSIPFWSSNNRKPFKEIGEELESRLRHDCFTNF